MLTRIAGDLHQKEEEECEPGELYSSPLFIALSRGSQRVEHEV